jgi:hypothetical protein
MVTLTTSQETEVKMAKETEVKMVTLTTSQDTAMETEVVMVKEVAMETEVEMAKEVAKETEVEIVKEMDLLLHMWMTISIVK